jgi:hypothetical protein
MFDEEEFIPFRLRSTHIDPNKLISDLTHVIIDVLGRDPFPDFQSEKLQQWNGAVGGCEIGQRFYAFAM